MRSTFDRLLRPTTLALALIVAVGSVSCADKGPSSSERRLAGGGTAAGVTASEVRDELVDVGGHRLHMRSAGSGSPAVVVDVGITGSIDEWRGIQNELARDTRVITYDRAGYGTSDPGPMPRTTSRLTDELAALLDAAGVEGSCVVVGHSLGALNACVFAHRHPERVAGLVLLDPPPIDFITGREYTEFLDMARRFGDDMRAEAARLRAAPQEGGRTPEFFEAVGSEHDMLLEGAAESERALESLGRIPLTVISAGVANPAFGDDYQRFWIEQNRALAARSALGEFVLAEDSTHHIHTEEPDLVVEQVRLMLARLGDSQEPTDKN